VADAAAADPLGPLQNIPLALSYLHTTPAGGGKQSQGQAQGHGHGHGHGQEDRKADPAQPIVDAVRQVMAAKASHDASTLSVPHDELLGVAPRPGRDGAPQTLAPSDSEFGSRSDSVAGPTALKRMRSRSPRLANFALALTGGGPGQSSSASLAGSEVPSRSASIAVARDDPSSSVDHSATIRTVEPSCSLITGLGLGLRVEEFAVFHEDGTVSAETGVGVVALTEHGAVFRGCDGRTVLAFCPPAVVAVKGRSLGAGAAGSVELYRLVDATGPSLPLPHGAEAVVPSPMITSHAAKVEGLRVAADPVHSFTSGAISSSVEEGALGATASVAEVVGDQTARMLTSPRPVESNASASVPNPGLLSGRDITLNTLMNARRDLLPLGAVATATSAAADDPWPCPYAARISSTSRVAMSGPPQGPTMVHLSHRLSQPLAPLVTLVAVKTSSLHVPMERAMLLREVVAASILCGLVGSLRVRGAVDGAVEALGPPAAGGLQASSSVPPPLVAPVASPTGRLPWKASLSTALLMENYVQPICGVELSSCGTTARLVSPRLHGSLLDVLVALADSKAFPARPSAPGWPVPRVSAASRAVVAAVAYGMVRALAYCHSVGLAHCDVQPGNVMFDELGRVRLIDFGLSVHFRCVGWEAPPPYGGTLCASSSKVPLLHLDSTRQAIRVASSTYIPRDTSVRPESSSSPHNLTPTSSSAGTPGAGSRAVSPPAALSDGGGDAAEEGAVSHRSTSSSGAPPRDSSPRVADGDAVSPFPHVAQTTSSFHLPTGQTGPVTVAASRSRAGSERGSIIILRGCGAPLPPFHPEALRCTKLIKFTRSTASEQPAGDDPAGALGGLAPGGRPGVGAVARLPSSSMAATASQFVEHIEHTMTVGCMPYCPPERVIAPSLTVRPSTAASATAVGAKANKLIRAWTRAVLAQRAIESSWTAPPSMVGHRRGGYVTPGTIPARKALGGPGVAVRERRDSTAGLSFDGPVTVTANPLTASMDASIASESLVLGLPSRRSFVRGGPGGGQGQAPGLTSHPYGSFVGLSRGLTQPTMSAAPQAPSFSPVPTAPVAAPAVALDVWPEGAPAAVGLSLSGRGIPEADASTGSLVEAPPSPPGGEDDGPGLQSRNSSSFGPTMGSGANARRVRNRGLSFQRNAGPGGAPCAARLAPQAVCPIDLCAAAFSGDMWAVGMVLLHLAGGVHPLAPDNEDELGSPRPQEMSPIGARRKAAVLPFDAHDGAAIGLALADFVPPQNIAGHDDSMASIIQSLLNRDPSNRPTAAALLDDEAFKRVTRLDLVAEGEREIVALLRAREGQQ